MEPCAGDGAIIRAVMNAGLPRPPEHWTAVEIRAPAVRKLEELSKTFRRRDILNVYPGDFFLMHRRDAGRTRFNVAMTNPPFSKAMQFILACMEICEHVLFLLRLNFLASAERAEFMQKTRPDIYVLPNRPPFAQGGKTDSIEYAWFHWWKGSTGMTRVLALTSLEERRADRR